MSKETSTDYARNLDLKRAKRRAKLAGASAKNWDMARSGIMLSDIETSPSLQLVGRLKGV